MNRYFGNICIKKAFEFKIFSSRRRALYWIFKIICLRGKTPPNSKGYAVTYHYCWITYNTDGEEMKSEPIS